MLLRVYSIYDSKVEVYAQPFFMHTKGQAIRAFTDAIADSSSQYAKHPADYTLFELSEYDDSLGKFVPHATPIALGLALDFMSVKI